MSRIRIGVSGWTYEPWRGSFYPVGLRQKDELAYASGRLHAIEINGTFYSLLKPDNYRQWYEQTPPGFRLALKGPKYITHERRLKDVATPLANFMASGILALRDKLGPILWQFPPSLAFIPERFDAFMAALPRTTADAAALGRGHSDWLTGRALLTTDASRPMLHAIEARHHSFKTPEFVEMARRHGIAVVVGDTAGRWPLIEDLTSDFVYVRLHGDETVYKNGYTKPALERWARRFADWSAGVEPADAALVLPPARDGRAREVFAFFDNDVKETAPFDALAMISRLAQLGLAVAPVTTAAPLPVADKSKLKAKKVAAKTTSAGVAAATVATARSRKARTTGKAGKATVERSRKPAARSGAAR